MMMMPPLLVSACKEAHEKQGAQSSSQSYTCSMHPQIVQDRPGQCPICGMELVAIDNTHQEAQLTLSESQQTLANITTITMGDDVIANDKRLNGRLVTDPRGTVWVSSRVPGRIEKLFVRQTGVPVKKGEPLYTIYSEQLASLQQEYLVAAAQAIAFSNNIKFQQIEKAARRKLLLYGQTDAQITRLAAAQQTSPYITYTAEINGVCAEVPVTQGQYVEEGGLILRLEGYESLWVEADIYPAEAAAVKIGQALQVSIPGSDREQQSMKVEFIAPALQPGSQLMQLRGTITNSHGWLRPGMQANVILPGNSRKQVLTLPADAVLRSGRGTHVWVQTGKGSFAPRRVSIGAEGERNVEITQGLQAGEQVVVTGVYLLDSEYKLKRGADPASASAF